MKKSLKQLVSVRQINNGFYYTGENLFEDDNYIEILDKFSQKAMHFPKNAIIIIREVSK